MNMYVRICTYMLDRWLCPFVWLQGSSSMLSQPDKPVFKPHVEHKHTEVRPFKFEERYQNKPNRDDYIRRKLEEEQKQLTEVRMHVRMSNNGELCT